MTAPPPAQSNFLARLTVIGPGLLIAATGVGAGDLATAAISGSRIGLAVLWAALMGSAFKFVLNEGLARYQLASGETILQGAITRLGVAAKLIFGTYLLLWSFFVANSLMSACGIALQAMWPLFDDPGRGQIVFGIAHSLLGVALVRLGGFRLFEKVMTVCIGVMFVVVMATAVLLQPDWGAVAKGLLTPRLADDSAATLQWTIALMGGIGGTLTVICYGYWIREKNRHGAGELTNCRIDLAAGYTMTALFGIAMVIIGSEIEVEGKGATLIVDLADRLEEPLGPLGRWAFLVGAWGAIFSSLLGVWQAVPYVFTDYLGLLRTPKGAKPPEVHTACRAYRGYLWALAVVPMAGLHLPFKEIQKVYAIFGAAFMPLLALTLLLLNGRRLQDANLRNRPLTNVVLVGILAFFAYAGYLSVTK